MIDLHAALAEVIHDENGHHVAVTGYVAVVEYVDGSGVAQTFIATPDTQAGHRTFGLLEFAAAAIRRMFLKAFD